MDKVKNVAEVVKHIRALLKETDKPYIDIGLLNAKYQTLQAALNKMGMEMVTKTISAHMCEGVCRAKYEAEAKVNIPQIYFGKGNFDSRKVGGGCCYVIVRK